MSIGSSSNIPFSNPEIPQSTGKNADVARLGLLKGTVGSVLGVKTGITANGHSVIMRPSDPIGQAIFDKVFHSKDTSTQ